MSESEDSDFIDNVRRRDAQDAAKQRAGRAAPRPRTVTNAGYAAQALANETANVRGATKGTRNDILNTACFNLGQLVQPGGLDFGVVVAELRSAALSVGLTERELQSWGLPERGIRDGMNKLRDLTEKTTGTPGFTPPPPPPVTLAYDDMEDGFWTSRKSLEDIYISALSRMCAPWSVLACCAARALAQVRPHIVLPDIIGGAGSLNWFGAITATSGGGKGAAAATARLLVKDAVQQRNTGSGEGMISAYVRPRTDDGPTGLHESLMFMVDEIDSLTAQTKRNGATTMSVLRSAFSGETLGFSYVNKNTPTIEAHTYRMTMVISVQPARAADLIADYHGGTPQRFMWFPGIDKRVTAELAGGFVSALTLPKPGAWQYPMTIQIPTSARELILRERVKTMQGNTAALDGHALFMREKFAFALAVLDGRTAVSEEDWELSGIAAKVSDTTRDWVVALAEEAKVDEATERGVLHGVSSVAADEEKSYRTDAKRVRMTGLILKHLKAADQQGLSTRELTNKIAARDRVWIGPILDQLRNDDAVRQDEKRWYIM